MRCALFLVILISIVGCKSGSDVEIVWDNNQAVAVSLNEQWDGAIAVRVQGSKFDVLGEIKDSQFTPSVPFQRGQAYDVFLDNRKVHSFTIPIDATVKAPQVVASFPSCDTVPENLLKMYIMFDQPMMEGRAYDFIHLIDRTTDDTVEAAFLDLQPELWNEDQTVLTLWLDPGRIKQDLIPNKKLGEVLNKDKRYELVVSNGWRSKSGMPMSDGYHRHFVTNGRDSRKPDPIRWKISGAGVNFDFDEPLDWSLIHSAISLWRDGKEISGKLVAKPCEKGFEFEPVEPLTPGAYKILVQGRLEDLAGNNLNRLFETDVTTRSTVSEEKYVHEIVFNLD